MRKFCDDATGLCGRIVELPEAAALDEFGAILLLDGWPAFSLPNALYVWVNVYVDECISDPKACLTAWDSIGMVGVLFVLLTIICILVPAYLDQFVCTGALHSPKWLVCKVRV